MINYAFQLDYIKILFHILVLVGNFLSIGFGIWHFFVPAIWKWKSYIDNKATELITAVRAINVFFSLSLILFGIINLLLIYGGKSNRYSIIVTLGATSILWLLRVILQLIFPQGSINPYLQFGMLLLFVIVSLCYIIPLIIFITKKIWFFN